MYVLEGGKKKQALVGGSAVTHLVHDLTLLWLHKKRQGRIDCKLLAYGTKILYT